MCSPYVYRPLNDLRTGIRLLTLDHRQATPVQIQGTTIASQACSISGSIRHVSLDEEPSYKALSYAWGDLASPRYPILVDGCVMFVTHNLFQALRVLQTLPHISSLWIDAVCINQIDNEEKSMQVASMHSIFSQAEEVLIWLGPTADHSNELISLLINWAVKYESVLETEGFEFLGSRYLKKQQMQAFLISISDGFPADLWLQPVAEFIARPWWHRIWVMQELVLAKRAVIYCGDVVVDWNVMERAIEIFSYPADLPECNLNFFNFAIQIVRIAHLRRLRLDYLGRYRDWTPGLTWEELLSHVMWPYLPEASDERDRIYGLMAFLRGEDRNSIAVDYSTDSTLAKILFDVSRVVIGRTGPRCMVLCDDWERHVNGTSLPGLPSWAPNWLSGRGRKFHPWEDVYDAARGTTWTPKLLPISFANPRFRLRGVLVDHIVKVWSQYDIASTDGEISAPTLYDFRSWSSDIGSAVTNTADVDNLWWLAVMPTSTSVTDSERKQLLASSEVFLGIRGPPKSLSEQDCHRWHEEESEFYRKALKFHRQSSFVTSDGYLGLGSLSIQVGNRLAIFEGCSVPFILRQREDGDYHLVGPCYVLNTMVGEIMENNPNFQDIALL